MAKWVALATGSLFLGLPQMALASETALHFPGIGPGLIWGLPFAGMLLSIALFPLLAPKVWEHHFGKITIFWSLTFLVPCWLNLGFQTMLGVALHTMLVEYLPFLILIFSLFVVAGGIRIVGNLVGTPTTNTAILGLGAVVASFLGTTGASMLLIRPVIRANSERRYNIHVFIFFIFIVSNIGGSLTPLGDPPLFLGFLKGVDFAWTMSHMIGPMITAVGLLLLLFYVIDYRQWRREAPEITAASRVPRQVRVEGLQNVLYLGGVITAVLISGLWEIGGALPVAFGITLPTEGLVRDVILLFLTYLSWKTTRPAVRIENAFTWTPIQEVAILFAGIFITMIPVLAILQAGKDGAFSPLVTLVSTPDGRPIDPWYFWLTGVLSSFLDNAPTYLVFFNLAGGDPLALMGPLASTLTAISAGAVFMGANSYIGNAPNFMVKSICEEQRIAMPSFFGYMLWSCAILLPLFALLTLIYF